MRHCGPDSTAYISNSPAGISLYCFRCGGDSKLFVPHERLSSADIMRMRKRADAVLELPEPDTISLTDPTVPHAALVWVLKAGLSPEVAGLRYGIRWIPSIQRVFVPVLHNGYRASWIARACDARPPKYLRAKGAEGGSWFDLRESPGGAAGAGLIGAGATAGRRADVVVCEDILSAIRIRAAGFKSMAVLGTSVSPEHARLLASLDPVGWFDNDAAGRKGFLSLRKAMAPYGVEVSRIQTDRDPKTYTRRQIREYIEQHDRP